VLVGISALARYNACMNKPIPSTRSLKITKIGNSAGIILSKDVLAALNANIGDEVSLTMTDDGVTLTPVDPEFEEEMRLARQIMRERVKVLRELAK
jgi:putative addiction module antidote